MINDVFRDRLRAMDDNTKAMDAHRRQLHQLAQARRALVVEMVDLAKRMGQHSPQAFVASRMGVSQQTVSRYVKTD